VIAGIDIGVRSFALVGWAGPEDEPLQYFHDRDKGRSRSEELLDLVNTLNDLVCEGDVLFVEEPPMAGARNIRTFAALNQVVGAILSANTAQKYLVPVDSWKKATVGKGGVGKDVVGEWLRVHHPGIWAECAGNQNLMDAACLALYGHGLVRGAGDLALSGRVDLPL
jgi:hypothetical protein